MSSRMIGSKDASMKKTVFALKIFLINKLVKLDFEYILS